MTDTQKRVGTLAVAAMAAAGIAYGTYYGITVSGPGDGSCLPWMCGSNSASVVGYPIHLDGKQNHSGTRLIEFEAVDGKGQTVLYGFDDKSKRFVDSTGRIARLDVVDSLFVLGDQHGATMPDHSLRKLVFQRKGEKHDITIRDARPVQDWARVPGHEPRQIPAYLFESQLRGSSARKLCQSKARWRDPGSAASPAQTASQEWNRASQYAVLLKGELYNPHTTRVEPGERWVSFACAGSALAKMKLMGYDPEIPRDAPLYTTPAQRQATLKMLTASYCETSKKLTHDGAPLAWQNAPGWFQPPWDLVRDVEARWSPAGATCLNEPRLAPRDKIIEACGEIPRCPALTDPPPTAGYPLHDNEWASFTRKTDSASNALASTAAQ